MGPSLDRGSIPIQILTPDLSTIVEFIFTKDFCEIHDEYFISVIKYYYNLFDFLISLPVLRRSTARKYLLSNPGV